MSMRIVLVRHGRPSLGYAWWIDADGFRRWRASYDAAGLAPGEVPPPELLSLAGNAGVVVASDLPRARASAELLRPGGEIMMSELLRETDFPTPVWSRARLPIPLWYIAASRGWASGKLVSNEPPAMVHRRAISAAELLAGLSAEYGTVIAVTHGSFRRFLCDALVGLGWGAPERRPLRHWSPWKLEAPRGAVPDR